MMRAEPLPMPKLLSRRTSIGAPGSVVAAAAAVDVRAQFRVDHDVRIWERLVHRGRSGQKRRVTRVATQQPRSSLLIKPASSGSPRHVGGPVMHAPHAESRMPRSSPLELRSPVQSCAAAGIATPPEATAMTSAAIWHLDAIFMFDPSRNCPQSRSYGW
jgi:hypothetical protein